VKRGFYGAADGDTNDESVMPRSESGQPPGWPANRQERDFLFPAED
jgi:hypothetical protein